MPPGSPDEPRRYLLAAGTATYGALDEDAQLASVANDLEVIGRLFGDNLGYQVEKLLDPTTAELRTWLSGIFKAAERRAEDLVAIYYPSSTRHPARSWRYACRNASADANDSTFNSTESNSNDQLSM